MQTDHGFVPDDLAFLVDFLNSTYPGAVDHLGSTDLFAAWLAGRGRATSVTPEQLAGAQGLRDGLRSAAMRNAGVATDGAPLARAEQALAGARIHVSLLDGRPPLAAGGAGADGALGEVAVALAAARLTGRWARVKACTGDGCGFVFWDGSRNGSRRWCDMQRCGSRQKMRTYRARAGARHRDDRARAAHLAGVLSGPGRG